MVEIEEPLKKIIKEKINSYEEMETKVQNEDARISISAIKTLTADISYFCKALSILDIINFKKEIDKLYNIHNQFSDLDTSKLELGIEKDTEPYKRTYEKSKPLIQTIKQKLYSL